MDECVTSLKAVLKSTILKKISCDHLEEYDPWLVALLPNLPLSVRELRGTDKTPHLLKLFAEGMKRHQLDTVLLSGFLTGNVEPLLLEHCTQLTCNVCE
uniref:PRAMEF12 n=1 Tax=Steinernema glaseri TaxID=37863 RepID=A0A1I7ZX52_9BILA